jgi:hypothetical protein
MNPRRTKYVKSINAVSAAELAKLDGIPSAATPVVSASVTFTETSGAGVWTGSITVPAGADIIDVIVQSTALWTSQTSATMTVGDTDDDGWYTGIDLKATDLLVGEDLSFEHPGGKAGVYLASEARTRYSATARTIAGIITKVGTTGTAGRTRLTVLYSMSTDVAATKV